MLKENLTSGQSDENLGGQGGSADFSQPAAAGAGIPQGSSEFSPCLCAFQAIANAEHAIFVVYSCPEPDSRGKCLSEQLSEFLGSDRHWHGGEQISGHASWANNRHARPSSANL
eukprot:3378044-Rhodomonas_salina.1